MHLRCKILLHKSNRWGKCLTFDPSRVLLGWREFRHSLNERCLRRGHQWLMHYFSMKNHGRQGELSKHGYYRLSQYPDHTIIAKNSDAFSVAAPPFCCIHITRINRCELSADAHNHDSLEKQFSINYPTVNCLILTITQRKKTT